MGKRDWATPNLMDEQPNMWTAGLCDCFTDCCGCLYVLFCFNCAAGDMSDRLDKNGCCTGCCLTGSSNICYMYDLRLRIRQRMRIQDSNDCCKTCFCTCCSACQMMSEVKRN